MKNNMGTIDKVVRIIGALIIILLYVSNKIEGTTAIVLLVLSGIFILTSFISFCPLYYPFGISTKKEQ
jgi:VIT1/CCC1 family predicted Fe2+/Mn2+ transporter